MQTVDQALEKLSRSDFRTKFHLDSRDRAYIAEKGMDTIRLHAEDFIAKRLAPACCCRGCLEKWYRVRPGVQLTDDQQRRLVNLLMAWIVRELERR